MGVYRGITQDNVTLNAGTAYNLNLVTPSIGGTALAATAAEINAVADVSTRLVSATDATLAVTVANHDSKIIVLNRAAGVTVTLPAATGSGAVFQFAVGTLVTSNSYKVQVADATDVMSGSLYLTDQAAGTGTEFSTVAASDTITMNGSTTGGLAGGLFTFVDLATNLYSVHGNLIATGAEATPFSAAV
tara:strand:+ start:6717 stop:7283 length:567 start_codon:yes stop_codon:yes gene_type:complete